MKIKHFTAPTATQAMSDIRTELGNDAVIISTETTSDGVVVTAALEAEQNINFDANDNLELAPSLQVYDDTLIRESLEYHDVVPDVAGQVLAITVDFPHPGEPKNILFLLPSLRRETNPYI